MNRRIMLLLLLYGYPIGFAFQYYFWNGVLGHDVPAETRASADASDLSA